MRIALKFGLLITFGVIVWVVIAHLLVPDPRSQIHNLGAGIFFNLLEITGIFLAINTNRNKRGGDLNFKSGMRTGILTALVYAVSSGLFFLLAIYVVGSKLMASEPGTETMPGWQVALGAFVGLSLGALIFGLLYSAIISFFLAKRQPH
jgi:hypothetical protein